MTTKSRGYVTVSIPKGIADEIDALMERLKYWPSRGAFVREACLEKIKTEKRLCRELESASGAHARGAG